MFRNLPDSGSLYVSGTTTTVAGQFPKSPRTEHPRRTAVLSSHTVAGPIGFLFPITFFLLARGSTSFMCFMQHRFFSANPAMASRMLLNTALPQDERFLPEARSMKVCLWSWSCRCSLLRESMRQAYFFGMLSLAVKASSEEVAMCGGDGDKEESFFLRREHRVLLSPFAYLKYWHRYRNKFLCKLRG